MKRKILLNKSSDSNNTSLVKETIDMWLQTASNGLYRIVMEKVQKPRTINQNRLMWLWFTAIAYEWSEATGRTITSQNVHDVYCELFLPVDTPRGRVGGETKSLNTEEMTNFLDKVKADAAEDGIELLNPEDRLFDMWREQYETNSTIRYGIN